jgi:hypothetical protein
MSTYPLPHFCHFIFCLQSFLWYREGMFFNEMKGLKREIVERRTIECWKIKGRTQD